MSTNDLAKLWARVNARGSSYTAEDFARDTRAATPNVHAAEAWYQFGLERGFVKPSSGGALLASARRAEPVWLLFDPDQPRDERGRWTDGGGSAENFGISNEERARAHEVQRSMPGGAGSVETTNAAKRAIQGPSDADWQVFDERARAQRERIKAEPKNAWEGEGGATAPEPPIYTFRPVGVRPVPGYIESVAPALEIVGQDGRPIGTASTDRYRRVVIAIEADNQADAEEKAEEVARALPPMGRGDMHRMVVRPTYRGVAGDPFVIDDPVVVAKGERRDRKREKIERRDRADAEKRTALQQSRWDFERRQERAVEAERNRRSAEAVAYVASISPDIDRLIVDGETSQQRIRDEAERMTEMARGAGFTDEEMRRGGWDPIRARNIVDPMSQLRRAAREATEASMVQGIMHDISTGQYTPDIEVTEADLRAGFTSALMDSPDGFDDASVYSAGLEHARTVAQEAREEAEYAEREAREEAEREAREEAEREARSERVRERVQRRSTMTAEVASASTYGGNDFDEGHSVPVSGSARGNYDKTFPDGGPSLDRMIQTWSSEKGGAKHNGDDQPGSGVEFRVDDVTGSSSSGITVSAELVDPATGDKIGESYRKFYRESDGTLAVYHGLYEIESERHQGGGLGEDITRKSIEMYRQAGIDRIDTTAAWVGRYTWPTFGFDYANSSDLETHKDILRDMVREHVEDEEQAALAIDAIDNLEHAWEVADFDWDGIRVKPGWSGAKKDKDGHVIPVHLGKAMLLENSGTSYTFDLHNGSPSMRRAKRRLHVRA